MHKQRVIRHSAKGLDDFKEKRKKEKPPRPPTPTRTVTYDLPPEDPAVISPSQHESVDFTRPVSAFEILQKLANSGVELLDTVEAMAP
jgi:hypothetical protein